MRPQKIRRIHFNPNVTYFKPQGIPLKNLEEIILTIDEIEAVRLSDLEGIDQIKCAKKMKVSQSTFQRIISRTNSKIADALINGKAIKIEGGKYKFAKLNDNKDQNSRENKRKFECHDCKHEWEEPTGTGLGLEIQCPNCQSNDTQRIDIEGHGPGRKPWGYKK